MESIEQLVKIDNEVPSVAKAQLMSDIATKMHSNGLLSETEYENAMIGIDQFNDGKNLFALVKGYYGVKKIVSNFMANYARIIGCRELTEDGFKHYDLQVAYYDPCKVFADVVQRRLPYETFVKMMIAVVERMRLDGKLTLDEAEAATNDFVYLNKKPSHSMTKVFELISTGYVFFVEEEETVLLGFENSGTETDELLTEKLREYGYDVDKYIGLREHAKLGDVDGAQKR